VIKKGHIDRFVKNLRQADTCMHNHKVNWFKVVYQQPIAMYDSGCQIWCNWSRYRIQPDFQYASTPKCHAADEHAPTYLISY